MSNGYFGRQEVMRATSMLRFITLGTVGFGVGWALLGAFGNGFPIAGGVGTVLGGAIFSGDLPALLRYALIFSLGGACGGAVLGWAFKDFRRVAILAVLGAVGFFVGSFIAVGLFFALSFVQAGYSLLEALSAAALGLVIGALLGLSLRSFRGTVVLALMGLVGFGIGGVIAATLQGFPLQPSEGLFSLPSAVFGAVEGTIGGVSLGAALGYLESRKPAEERRPRVR
jgi:hypothetical protein